LATTQGPINDKLEFDEKQNKKWWGKK